MHYYEMPSPYYTFEYVEGMTWNQFVNSSYNVSRETGAKLCDIDANGYVIMLINMPSTTDTATNYVKGTDIIESPANYVHESTSKRVAKHNLGDVCRINSDHYTSKVEIYNGLLYCPRCADLFTGWYNANYYENGLWVSGCFVAGTKILMSDGTEKNIEDMQVGDRVVSYNRKTGEFYDVTVTQTMKDEITNAYFDVTLENGTTIGVTGNHPILTNKGYECIFGESDEALICDTLDVGDKVFTVNGYQTVVAIVKHEKKTRVYNISVADDDEIKSGEDNDEDDIYIVNGIAAHNTTHSGGA